MKTAELLATFDRALAWNAALYGVYKICNILVTFYLYSKLTPYDFCLWANINSSIFIILLWSDCGLRYAITQFMPYINSSKSSDKLIYQLTGLKCLLLCLATPLMLHTTSFLYGTMTTIQTSILATWFIAEGFVGFIQTLYHAQFLNKRFNTIRSSIHLGELLIFFIVCQTSQNPFNIFTYFSIKAGSALATNIFAMLFFKIKDSHATKKNTPQLKRAIIRHATVLWGTTVLKSLSERNVLMPLVTFVSGVETAAMFKLALDGALFLQRTVLKTIGSADSALLAHALYGKDIRDLAQEHLIKRVSVIISVTVALIIIISYIQLPLTLKSDTIVMFFMLLLCYAVELRLLPYERSLEANQQYLLLIKIYSWYFLAFMLCCILFWQHIVQLTVFLCTVQGVRVATISFITLKALRRKSPT